MGTELRLCCGRGQVRAQFGAVLSGQRQCLAARDLAEGCEGCWGRPVVVHSWHPPPT